MTSQATLLYYNCNLFENEDFVITNKFFVEQEELLCKNYTPTESVFKKISVKYSCEWIQSDMWDVNLSAVLIPIKDNKELIKFTISNLKENDIHKNSNIIIIDDRSEENIKSIALENNLSYLRVDNDKGFNFSMLNNIAAKICYELGVKDIILWNSDLWCVKKEWFLLLLEKHRNEHSTISGSKLVYPPSEMSLNEEEDTENIRSFFPNMINGRWRETIQFGGSGWFTMEPRTSPVSISPIHCFRFCDITDNRVNCDKGESFVTGALQVIDLKWFIDAGGLNPSLSKNFQDVDICLKAIKNNKKIFYFGKNMYFYHDESASLAKGGKHDDQLFSDHVLFGKIWNKHIYKLVLGIDKF